MKRLLSVLVLVLILTAGCGGAPRRTTGAAAREKPYVASAIREPFHKNSCKWAAKIAEDNLVGYDTRQEAIDDGHRPCKVCRP